MVGKLYVEQLFKEIELCEIAFFNGSEIPHPSVFREKANTCSLQQHVC